MLDIGLSAGMADPADAREAGAGAAAKDEVAGVEARFSNAVEHDEVTAKIDRGGAVHFMHRVHHRLVVRKTEGREIDLVGAGGEVTDHVAAGAVLEDEGVGTTLAE